ncbi:MAG TPA: NCS2 family permease [Patescibacteria group bacterium]|nr:NCS2 family permease [Patescibacteria group bacterium]
MSLADFLAALGVIINALPGGLYAMTFGFASVPTSLGFLIGAIGCGLLGVVSPVSFQAETLTLAGTMGRNIQERLSIVFWEGVFLLIIGLLGLFKVIVAFIGPVITSGMMAGVGIILARVAVEMTSRNPVISGISIVSALLTYYLVPNPAEKLVYTIVICVAASSLAGFLLKKPVTLLIDPARERFVRQKILFNRHILRGALGISALNVGANIAFGNITAQTLAKTSVDLDHLTIISSLADMASSLFGGAPVQAIISATGAAPHPLAAGVLMMALMAAILVAGLLPKIARYVPNESISGFLLVLGAIVTVPVNAGLALQSGLNTPESIVGGVTITVTAITDPFFGMVAGLLVRFLISLCGI